MGTAHLARRSLRRLLSFRVRLVLCTTLGAWPLVTTILAAASPFTAGWPLMARTAVAVPLIVVGMVFVVGPLVNRLAGSWIAAGATRDFCP